MHATGERSVSAERAARPPEPMTAIVYTTYGPPDEVLKLKEIDRPTPGDGEALVRVRAAGVNIGVCYSVRGAPFAMRLSSGLFKPTVGIPGVDLAGTVDSVGPGVTSFKPGDEVFGVADGACAEYALAQENKLARKPAKLTFEEAAAIPVSALAALHGLRDKGRLQPGQTVLINGASGGIGTCAVQIAKTLGATVTGVCGPANVALVRSLGADEVFDYSQHDFTNDGKQYDLIFDNVENRSLSDLRRALAPTGTLLLNSGTGAKGVEMLVRLAMPFVLSPFTRQRLVRYLSRPNQADLEILRGWIEAGALKPVIDRVYPLRETAAALARIEGGHVRGKIVIAIAA